MSVEADPRLEDVPAICPVCGGSGEIVHIDEEVGCQLTEPCWRCLMDAASVGKDA